jgi:hypothetical protein
MKKSDRVAASSARAMVEELLIARKPLQEIIQTVAEKTGEAFDIDDVSEYNKDYLMQGKGLVNQVISVTKDLSKNEIPPVSDAEHLANFFSFKNTTDDLEMIYGRVRELREAAKKHPDDDSYDARVVKYLDQAEKIRARVIKNQFDALRKTILLTIGKKIAAAAVAVFIPYVSIGKRDEARKKFLAAIEPLIDTEMVPKTPEDIQEVEKELDG